jgi:hypothetical protein
LGGEFQPHAGCDEQEGETREPTALEELKDQERSENARGGERVVIDSGRENDGQAGPQEAGGTHGVQGKLAPVAEGEGDGQEDAGELENI